MWAICIHFLFPVIPYVIWKIRNKDRKTEPGEIILRYSVYFLLISFMTAIALGILSGTDTSFWVKINGSLEFAVKFVCLELIAAFAVAAGERFYHRSAPAGAKAEDVEEKTAGVWKRLIASAPVYLLAILVIGMNVALMFDNAVWGDEAFSVNTAEKSVYGIMQVMYFWENHPPLYYFWLKLFGELFGFSIPVCHLASLVPFIGGIIIAVTAFRKQFGNVPAAVFVVVSGLGSACLQYNLEIRMYALAFVSLMVSFYCSYRVISTGRRRAWVGMVLWALAGAYSHYYALVAAGGILFMTGVCVWLKNRGNTWRKGLGAIIAFLLAYAPWMFFLFHSMKNIKGNWWATEIMKLGDGVSMVMGNAGMDRIILPLFLLLVVTLFAAESGIFQVQEEKGEYTVRLQKPSVKNWSDETYAMAVGMFTIVGTIVFGYLLCLVMGPVFIQRYLYPLSAVAICMLVMGSSRIFRFLKQFQGKIFLFGPDDFAKTILVSLTVVLAGIGLQNYRLYSTQAEYEKVKTDEVLSIIGEPEEDVKMVTNGVKHLGWTVLYHYYPDNEIVNGDYRMAESDRFWYFNPGELADWQIEEMQQNGKDVISYGQRQISQYPFWLYYIEDSGRRESLEALSAETYEGVFLSMYDISNFSVDDFRDFKGVPSYKSDYQYMTANQINEAVEAVFSSGNAVTNVCLGLDPLILWHSEKEDISMVQAAFEAGWLHYADTYPEISFEVLLPFPSMDYWLSLEEEELQSALILYQQLAGILESRSNIVSYFVGSEEWLINNPSNYISDFATNELVSQKIFLLTFCDHMHEMNSTNSPAMMEKLWEQIVANKDSAGYPDLSQWDIVFFGDSIIGNYEGSYSIPGVVNGISGAAVYNCAQGGVSASGQGPDAMGFPWMAKAFTEGQTISTEMNLGQGIEQYRLTGHEGRKTCFIVNYGINDYYGGHVVENTEDPYDTTTYAGAMRIGILTLQEKYPDARYIMMGPGRVTLFGEGTELMSEKSGRLADYYEAAKAVAGELGVFYLDLYEEFPNEKDDLEDVLADGTHYGEYGRYAVGIKIINFLDEIQ